MPAQMSALDLQLLQNEVVALGSLVESMLLESVDQLQRCDLDALEQLGDTERQIHQKRLAIEMGCLRLIAEQRPRGAELRHAVAMVEIASELERVAEHGKKVSRANSLTMEYHLRKPVAKIHRFAADVQAMLSRAVEAFARSDIEAVRALLADAQTVDDQYTQVYQELLEVMNSRPRVVNQAVFVSRAAYNLKRAAERVTGICDWVLFSAVGSMEGNRPEPARQEHHTELERVPARAL